MICAKKKTECPSAFKFTIFLPTKKDKRLSSSLPYLVSHPAVFQIQFNHNHPIQSAHTLSFRPISPETKEAFFKLFRKGHSASSAHHWHETRLLLDGNEDQLILADRATNPTKTDISRLYQEWHSKELGAENGKALFDKLDAEIASYNAAHFSQGGQAKLQVFQCEASSTDSDSEAELTVPVSKKRKRRSQPMIIAICTPLMSRVHQNIQQSCEMVFCDATSSLDRFNSSLFILSTSTCVGALPLGVIITSDEEQDTIRDGLKLLNDVWPDHSFYGHGKASHCNDR